MGILSVLGSPRPTGTPVGSATQITTSQLPSEFKPFITDIFEKAKAQQEGLKYIPFTGPRIRGFGPLQEEAFTGLTDLARKGISTLPEATSAGFLTGAEEAAARAGRAITVEDIQRLSSPFQQEVIDIAKRKAQEDFDIQVAPKIAAESAAARSFGGSRAGIIQEQALQSLQEQLSDIQTKGSAQAFAQAQQAFQDERAAAAGLSGFLERQMTAVPNQALKELASLQSVGESKQLLDQQALNLAYQDFLEEREFPTRSLQEYQASVRGFPYTPAAYQYSSSTTPTPSLGQTLLSAAAQGAGLYGSLGGFGFGTPTQKAASGGQIRGGLSGVIEAHQNNVRTRQNIRTLQNSKRKVPFRSWYTPFHPRVVTQEEEIIPEVVKAATVVAGKQNTIKKKEEEKKGLLTQAEEDVFARSNLDPSGIEQISETEGVVIPSTNDQLAALTGLGIGDWRAAADDEAEAYKNLIASTKTAYDPIGQSISDYISTYPTSKRNIGKQYDARSKRLGGRAKDIGKRIKESDEEHTKDLVKYRDIQRRIGDSEKKALTAAEDAQKKMSKAYQSDIDAIGREETIEKWRGLAASGKLTKEEIALGAHDPFLGLITTLGNMAGRASEAMAPELRKLSKDKRAKKLKQTEQEITDIEKVNKINTAILHNEKGAFLDVKRFVDDHLTKKYNWEDKREAILADEELSNIQKEEKMLSLDKELIMLRKTGAEVNLLVEQLELKAKTAATKNEKEMAEAELKALKDFITAKSSGSKNKIPFSELRQTLGAAFGDSVSFNSKGDLIISHKGVRSKEIEGKIRKYYKAAVGMLNDPKVGDTQNERSVAAIRYLMDAGNELFPTPKAPPADAITNLKSKATGNNLQAEAEAFQKQFHPTLTVDEVIIMYGLE